MPSKRIPQFTADISRARDLVGLGQSIGGLTQGLVDASDLYRSGLVQGVAALDAYVHGVVLDRAVDIVLGRLTVPSMTMRIGLHFVAVRQLLAAALPGQLELLARTYVAERLALETYQRPDDIASALAMVGVSTVWSSAFPADPSKAKTSIGVIVGRRNRIVHACDADPLVPGSVTPLSDADALAAISTVETTVVGIDRLL